MSGSPTGGVRLRALTDADHPAILRLNDAAVQHTSPMDDERLRVLLGLACHARVVTVDGAVVAFLIAMAQDAPYQNDNFGWFAARLPAFLYVDRVVVDAAHAGGGIGRRLYEDLFACARTRGIPTVTCEYNLEPPNPASLAFHDRFGFRELGTQWLAGGTKRVSLQTALV